MSRNSWNNYQQYGGRRKDFREIRQRFLIVCEGKKTEPNYFEGFKVPKVIVDIEPGAGTHVSVIKKAMSLRDKASGDYDQVWCVLDRDKDVNNKKNSQNFNEALMLAQKEGIQVAYTNDAFELWYLLHYNFYDTAVSRKQYIKMLTKVMGSKYEKNDPGMFDKLESRVDFAIKNAVKLLKSYNPSNPEKDDPSTTVHLLVKELRKFMK